MSNRDRAFSEALVLAELRRLFMVHLLAFSPERQGPRVVAMLEASVLPLFVEVGIADVQDTLSTPLEGKNGQVSFFDPAMAMSVFRSFCVGEREIEEPPELREGALTAIAALEHFVARLNLADTDWVRPQLGHVVYRLFEARVHEQKIPIEDLPLDPELPPKVELAGDRRWPGRPVPKEAQPLLDALRASSARREPTPWAPDLGESFQPWRESEAEWKRRTDENYERAKLRHIREQRARADEVDEGRTFPDKRNPEEHLDWLLRYQVGGESMTFIAGDRASVKKVSKPLKEYAQLLGLELRPSSRGGRPRKRP